MTTRLEQLRLLYSIMDAARSGAFCCRARMFSLDKYDVDGLRVDAVASTSAPDDREYG